MVVPVGVSCDDVDLAVVAEDLGEVNGGVVLVVGEVGIAAVED